MAIQMPHQLGPLGLPLHTCSLATTPPLRTTDLPQSGRFCHFEDTHKWNHADVTMWDWVFHSAKWPQDPPKLSWHRQFRPFFVEWHPSSGRASLFIHSPVEEQLFSFPPGFDDYDHSYRKLSFTDFCVNIKFFFLWVICSGARLLDYMVRVHLII